MMPRRPGSRLPALVSTAALVRALGVLGIAAATALAACSLHPRPGPEPHATRPTAPENPEAASGYRPKPGWWFRQEAVAAAHPLAAQAGADILRQGGSAVDAAVAVQMVLGVVEPQASGIGGGAFLLLRDGPALLAYDGRETAPAQADEALLLDPTGRPLPFDGAAIGGRSVGTPGVPRLLEHAHARHGRLPWALLFEPAIRLAAEGFAVSPRLHAALQADKHLRQDPSAARLYYQADGTPWPVGHRLRNPELADTLRALARQGADSLHHGPIAKSLVDKVRLHPANPGRLSLDDLAGYRPRQREPLCWTMEAPAWKRRVQVCGFPPPSSGALAVGQIVQLMALSAPAAGLAPVEPVAQVAPSSPALDPGPEQRAASIAGTGSAASRPVHWLDDAAALHRYVEASRLAFADRARYVGDPDFVAAPGGGWHSLLDPSYLRLRATLIGPTRTEKLPAGQPGPQPAARVAGAPRTEQPEWGTSHFSIVDRHGQALAMTSSIEQAFGARLMVGGFLLNNQLTDFAFLPRDEEGRPVANRVQPGKRPRSSMSPTMVFDARSGELLMSTGGAGGSHIIHHTAQLLLSSLVDGLDVQQAVSLPRIGLALDGGVLAEAGRLPGPIASSLGSRGHTVGRSPLTSGQQAIERRSSGWFVGADPRREGTGAGQ